MPDLSRSCWRKIACKNITEDVKGRLSCGLQPGCPLTLLPQKGCHPHAVCHTPAPPHQPAPDLVPQDLELHQPKAGTAIFLGSRGSRRKQPAKGGGVKAKPSDSSHLRQQKPGHTWPAQFSPQLPRSVLQHQQDQSLQPSGETAMLKLAAMPLPGSSCAAAVGSTSLWCPWSKTGLACSKRGCCKARLENGLELLLCPHLTTQLPVLVQAGTQAMAPVTLHLSSATAGQDGLGEKTQEPLFPSRSVSKAGWHHGTSGWGACGEGRHRALPPRGEG